VKDQKPRAVYLDINHWYALARADELVAYLGL